MLSKLLLMCVMLASSQAFAELIDLPLSTADSSVKLQVEGPLLSAAGEVRKYSGMLSLDRADFSRSKVTIEADLSGIVLQADGQMGGLNFAPLFQRIKNPRGVFSSSSIKRLSANRYLVSGSWVRAGKTQQIELPVEIVRIKAGDARFRIRLTKEISSTRSLEGVDALLAGSIGSADALLVFSKRAQRAG